MEVNTQRRAAGLKDKIPDIQKTLDTVHFLKTRKVCLLYMEGEWTIIKSMWLTH